MPAQTERCLVDHRGAPWIIRVNREGILEAVSPGARNPIAIGKGSGGWDACVDYTGRPWIAWSEHGDSSVVYVRSCLEGEWGPRFQVSTGEGDISIQPLIRADEYGNVWIIWLRPERHEAWVCRMGARSGQETRVAGSLGRGCELMDASSRQGVLSVLLRDQQAHLYRGTENEGFHEVPIPSG